MAQPLGDFDVKNLIIRYAFILSVGTFTASWEYLMTLTYYVNYILLVYFHLCIEELVDGVRDSLHTGLFYPLGINL